MNNIKFYRVVYACSLENNTTIDQQLRLGNIFLASKTHPLSKDLLPKVLNDAVKNCKSEFANYFLFTVSNTCILTVEELPEEVAKDYFPQHFIDM